MKEIATFGAGCFWHVELEFSKLKGVLKTEVGYMGGRTKNPRYKDVCTGETGHAEVTQITYDPSKIRYEKLLEKFWEIHDPTQKDRQGPDIGNQYRSAIFYHTEEQKKEAEKSRMNQNKIGKKIVTEILPAGEFYRAEEYHQKYLEKGGLSACPI